MADKIVTKINPTKPNLPVIAGVEITTDPEWRFNLNALHRASGGKKKHGPSYWLALDTTKALVAECEKQTNEIPVVSGDTEIPVSPINIVKGNFANGQEQGTFAHKLLAISYAGWISPAFQLQVNQVFLDYKTGNLTDIPGPIDNPSFIGPAEEFKAAYSVAQLLFSGNQAKLSANKAVRRLTGVDLLDYLGATHLIADEQEALLTVTEIGQRAGIPRNQVNLLLEKVGLQKGYRDHKNKQRWELTAEGQDYGIYQDTGKKHSDGTPVRQIKWYARLVAQLQRALAAIETESTTH